MVIVVAAVAAAAIVKNSGSRRGRPSYYCQKFVEARISHQENYNYD